MKTRESPALAAPTVAFVFKEKLDQLKETSPSQVSSQGSNSDSSTFSKILKPHSSSQKSLEIFSSEIKRVLKETATKLEESPAVPITNEETRLWLLTLLSFHPEKKVTMQTALTVTLVKGQATI